MKFCFQNLAELYQYLSNELYIISAIYEFINISVIQAIIVSMIMNLP